MIKGASEEMLEAQYCANGNYEGWLSKCGMKKLRNNRIASITTDEWQAMVSESNLLRNKGNSDGHF